MAVNEVVVNGVTELSLANDTVSETSLLDGETAHAANGNLIVGKAKYINPNLLINPDFSINQRGQTEYPQSSNTVDCWSTDQFTSVQVLGSGRIRIIATADRVNTPWWALRQPLENVPTELCTQSMRVTAVQGHWYLPLLVNGADDFTPIVEGINHLTGTPIDTVGVAMYNCKVGDYIELEWIKLEPGTVATSFVKPNPAVELVKCQRYFRTLSRGVHVEYAGTNGTDVVIRVPFEVPMRVAPTCFIMNHKASLHYCNGWIEASDELTILNVSATPYGITFLHVSGFNLSGLNLQIGQNLTLDTDNAFGISAEL